MKRNVIIVFAILLGLSWITALVEAADKPKKIKEHLERAAELEEKEIYVDALQEYSSALEYDPDNQQILVKMAQASLSSGDSRKFISICENTAERYQDNTEALDMLMQYYTDNDYDKKAVKYLKEFTDEYPDNENAGDWFLKLAGTYDELYCRYDEISGIVNDTMVVRRDGMYGIADAKCSEIIAPEYKALCPFSEDGLALAQKTDGSWVYIDQDGQTRKAPDREYQDLGMFSSERAAAKKDGKYAYLDEDMEPVCEFEWDFLTAFSDRTGAGETDGKWALVNKKGEAKNDEWYDGIIVDENGFCSKQKRVFVIKEGLCYMTDTKGKEIGKLTFEDAKAFTDEGYAAVCSGGKWGFVNTDGELVIDYAYEDAESFCNGYAAVCTDGLWGYIDEEGHLIIEPEFTEATYFSSLGTALVKVENQGEEEWRLIQLNMYQ